MPWEDEYWDAIEKEEDADETHYGFWREDNRGNCFDDGDVEEDDFFDDSDGEYDSFYYDGENW